MNLDDVERTDKVNELPSTFLVHVQEMDYDSRVDPSILDGYKSDLSKMHFDESHPSIIVPKHPYKRYRMRKNVNKTGLNILKEGPVQNSSFAIMNLLSKSEAPNSMH